MGRGREVFVEKMGVEGSLKSPEAGVRDPPRRAAFRLVALPAGFQPPQGAGANTDPGARAGEEGRSGSREAAPLIAWVSSALLSGLNGGRKHSNRKQCLHHWCLQGHGSSSATAWD